MIDRMLAELHELERRLTIPSIAEAIRLLTSGKFQQLTSEQIRSVANYQPIKIDDEWFFDKAGNPRDRKFCDGCGARLSALPSPQPLASSPLSYTPKHRADKILTSRAALEGERKQVTVLFADVKGSMELAEQVDPEEWHRIPDRFFRILTDGVHRFEGTVNQYTGDGIMVLFGS